MLSTTNPIFYRISKQYHSYFEKQILKHKDGKNRIRKTDTLKELPKDSYNQHYDENGVYYVDSKTGERL
jgi:hypothetical protein